MKSAFFLIATFCTLFCQVSSSLVYRQSQSYQTSKYDFFTARQSNVNIVDCSTPNDILELTSFTISPEQVVPGGEIAIAATGTLKETIEYGAYADVTVKLGLVRLLHKQFDICEELEKSGNELKCPLAKGEITFTQTVTLPKEIPPAKFTVSARGYTVDEQDIGCFAITANFMKQRSRFG